MSLSAAMRHIGSFTLADGLAQRQDNFLLLRALAASLDSEGRAGPDTVRRVLDQVRTLADGVRGARKAAA